MRVYRNAFLAILCLVSSCSGNGESNSSNIPQETNNNSILKRNEHLKKIANRVLERSRDLAQQLGDSSTCNEEKYSDPDSLCFLEEVSFKSTSPSNKSNGKRILILDWRMTYFGLTTYKKSILGSFQFNPNTNELEEYPYDYVQGRDKFKIPRFYHEIHNSYIGESPIRVPGKAFRSLYENYTKKTLGLFDEYFSISGSLLDSPSYGMLSLAFLHDHVPDAQFVLVNEETLDRFHLSAPDFCDINNKTDEWLKSHFQSKSNQIGNIAQFYDVDFIVVPENYIQSEMEMEYSAICENDMDDETRKSIGRLYNEIATYHDSISNLPDVTIFHSAPESLVTTEHHLCKAKQNRIVTGGTLRNTIFTDIPSQGIQDIAMHTERQAGNQCIDAFTQIGHPWDENELSTISASFSMLDFNDERNNTIVYLGNSRLSAPVVLAYAIHKMETAGWQKDQLKQNLNEFPVIDPMSHSQTNACSKDPTYCDYSYKYFNLGDN